MAKKGQRGVAKHLSPTVDDLKVVTLGVARRATTTEAERHRKAEDLAAKLRAKILAREVAVVTKPGDPGGYRGEYNCSDCCSMSHCETHHKDEDTYPFDETVLGVDESLDREGRVRAGMGPTNVSAQDVLKAYFPERKVT